MPPGYGIDLAYIHDTGFGGFARAAAPCIKRMLRRAGISKGLVVDLGSGSGILARELTDSGYDVLGVDISPAFVDLARRNAPAARFAVGSLRSFDLPHCAAVTAAGECVNYSFDETPRDLRPLFRRVYKSLAPGGLFIFDVAGPGRAGTSAARSFVEGDDWYVLVEREEDAARRILTRRIVTFRRVGKLYRRSEEIHRLNLYDPVRLRGALEQIGFRASIRKGYCDSPLPRGHAVLLARKPA
jgi:SAM-dependent methyltransferase